MKNEDTVKLLLFKMKEIWNRRILVLSKAEDMW